MNPKRRTENMRRPRRRLTAVAATAAVTILFTISLPQHAVLATSSTSSAHHEDETSITTYHHPRRKLAEQRRRMAERRRLLEEKWTAEAIQNLQTLDYVLDESDDSNTPRYFIRSRDGMLLPPFTTRVDEDIISLEEEENEESSSSSGTSNTVLVHHEKSRLGPTNNDHLQIMSQFQHWQSGDRNLRGSTSIIHVNFEPGSDEDLDEITFIYDEDDPEEDVNGYDLVYIGSRDNTHLHQQQQRELSLANKFVNSMKEDPQGKPPPNANTFVNSVKEGLDPMKGKPPPKGKGKDQLLPFGRRAKLFHQIFPDDGSVIGTVQAFGAQTINVDEMKKVSIQFKDHNNKRSKWKDLPQSMALRDWFMEEIEGFPPNTTWMYRIKGKSTSGDKEITAWMELAINIVREETSNPTLLPTPNPTPKPSPDPTSLPTPNPTPRPTSSPTPRPSPDPTLPPSPQPTPGPTSSPTPDPTPYPVDSSSQWTAHPTKHPTTKPPTNQPTSPPSNNPTSPPTNVPTSPPSNNPTTPPSKNPTSPPTKNPTKPPTIQPTSPPTPEATEAVQQAPAQLLHRSVRDAAWEYGGKCS